MKEISFSFIMRKVLTAFGKGNYSFFRTYLKAVFGQIVRKFLIEKLKSEGKQTTILFVDLWSIK